MNVLQKLFNKNLLKSRKIIYCSLISFILTSCITTKHITYFQSNPSIDDDIVSQIEKKYIPSIQAGDILSIVVSSLDKRADEMFNPIMQQTVSQNATQNVGTTAPAPVIGFTVNDSGFIVVPMLGKVHVAGLTSQELSSLLSGKYSEYLESPMVMVRIANFKISVLGEVARPAVYTVPNEMITLTEALALAGDLTLYGKRKNVLVIREENGIRQFGRVDLTSREVFLSPYYYLHSGDIVYVEPSSGKITSSDRLYQLTPIVISSLTLLVLIINTFVK